MTTFTGFSEEDLLRIKSGDSGTANDVNNIVSLQNARKIDKLGLRHKKSPPYKLPQLAKLPSDEEIDSSTFDKCRLSLKSPTSPQSDITNNTCNSGLEANAVELRKSIDTSIETDIVNVNFIDSRRNSPDLDTDLQKCGIESGPDIVRGVTNYSEDDQATHKAKLGELQLKQRLMEEQNKRRKEMLAKALADRTKQTTEEVMRLEKIKQELQVLDGQFSRDVAVLRKKIDHACLTFADAEKHYLKVEKEFLQAKIHLQNEKEKKELLTEHLSALITHNETRKAQKLETLMLQLVDEKIDDAVTDEEPVIVDGVDERTGKIVEISLSAFPKKVTLS